jgi:hypothetical protein
MARGRGDIRVECAGTIAVDLSPLDPHPPSRQSYQPKTVGPAFVGVILIKQRRCLIMAVR